MLICVVSFCATAGAKPFNAAKDVVLYATTAYNASCLPIGSTPEVWQSLPIAAHAIGSVALYHSFVVVAAVIDKPVFVF